jgi:hypothetical protein
VPLPLALLLAVGALQVVGWDVALPAFQGPDEAAHFGYVQYLAETGRIPNSSGAAKPNSTQAGALLRDLNLEATLGNLTGRPAWSSLDLTLWRSVERSLPPGSAANGSGPNQIAKNPPLYYAVMAVPYRLLLWLPLLKRLFLMRLFSSLFYLATIALTWVLAGELLGRVRWKQTLATGVVALQPKLAFMGAVINADILLIALTTAFLLAAVRLVRRGATMRRVLVASLLAAAASLTQGRGLATIPVLAVALLVTWIRHRPAARAALSAAGAAAGTLLFAFVAYLEFGRGGGGAGLYGGQVHEVNSGPFNIRQFLSSIWQFYLPRLPGMHKRIGPEYGYRQVFIETFYGTFASLEVIFPKRVSDFLQVLSAIGLVGLCMACVAKWRRLISEWPTVVVLVSLPVVTLLLLHYASYRALLGNGGTDPLITGRYLLPMISLFGLAIAFTVGSLPRRVGPPVGAAILSIGVLLSLAGIGLTAARFYA